MRREKKFERVTLVLTLLAWMGCMGAAPSQIDNGASNEGSVFVVEPGNVDLSAEAGALETGKDQIEFFRPYTRLTNPVAKGHDGLVVMKLKPGETYALDFVVMPRYMPFKAIPGSPTVVFSVPAGKVLYITDVSYSVQSGRVHPAYRSDFEGARALLGQKDPAMASQLEQGSYLVRSYARSR